MSAKRIFIVDNNLDRGEQIKSIFEFIEYEVSLASYDNFSEVGKDLDSFGLIMVGINGDRLASVVKELSDRSNSLPIILIGDQGASHALPSAVDEVITTICDWPTTHAILTEKLERIQEVRQNNRRTGGRSLELFRSLGGASQEVEKTRKLIKQVADKDAIVLILGESGTGKEVVARNLHYYSSRRRHPFVPVNCGAIPSELLESELFGHEKGAFSGALSSRQGRFELAEGGTLFLDEIGDMPLAMQVKMLRVLQEKTFERVGSNKTIHCDVRIIAATHRDLEEEIRQNRFREDLYYRLNVFPITVPSLRERAEDIPALVSDLVARIQHENRGSVRFSSAALRVLAQYDWPGNVRELANLVERLAILHPQGVVERDDLPEKFQRYKVNLNIQSDSDTAIAEPLHMTEGSVESENNLPSEGIDLKEHLIHLECDLIRRALDESDGIVAHAAKLLKMRRTTLVEKMRKYDIQRIDDVPTI